MTTGKSARWLRHSEDIQQPTLIELFFDLVFVFALTQLSQALAKHLTGGESFHVLLLIMAVWLVWSMTTWATDLYTHSAGLSLLIIAMMFGVVLMASSLSRAFSDRGLTFAITYVLLQNGRTGVLLLAVRRHPMRRRPARVLFWLVSASPLWLAGGALHGTPRVVLWATAIVVDYAGPNLGWPTPGLGRSAYFEWNLVAEHLAERYRQILIIALGDTVLSMGRTYAATPAGALHTLALLTAFTTTALFWQIYSFPAAKQIHRAFGTSTNRARQARKVDWSHLVMVAGSVVTAVGNELVIDHPTTHTRWPWVAVITGGPAVFLAGRIHFSYVVDGRLSLRALPAGLLALAVLAPVATLLPSILAAAVAALVLLGTVAPYLPAIRQFRAEPTSGDLNA